MSRVKEREREESESESIERQKLVEIKERIGSLRTKLSFQDLKEEDLEESRKCEELRKRWLRDFSDIFKETLTKQDRLNIPLIKIALVEGHQNIQTFKPKTPIEVSPYMEPATKKELSRIVEVGMLDEINYYTEHLSRGFFVEKPGKSDW